MNDNNALRATDTAQSVKSLFLDLETDLTTVCSLTGGLYELLEASRIEASAASNAAYAVVTVLMERTDKLATDLHRIERMVAK